LPRQNYAKPPIVEVIMEFQLAGAVSAQQLEAAIMTGLPGVYTGRREVRERIDVAAHVTPQTVETSAKRTPHVTFLRTPNGRRVVACGENLMSVHVLAPYPGWENFIDQVIEAVGAATSVVGSTALASVGVRYIDQITFANRIVNLDEYLSIMPPSPANDVNWPLQGFNVLTQRVSPDGIQLTLGLASAAPEDGRVGVVLDVLARKSLPPGTTLADGSWRAAVETLHSIQGATFEGCIKDPTRELFR
jgi:uncharacterized protein (TIGR04255 family)